MLERFCKWYDRVMMAWWASMVAFRGYMKLDGFDDISTQTLYDRFTAKPQFILIIAVGQEAADLRKLLETHGNFSNKQ